MYTILYAKIEYINGKYFENIFASMNPEKIDERTEEERSRKKEKREIEGNRKNIK